jgi:hypothetical protein
VNAGRAGSTLLEILTALILLGVIAGVTTLALRRIEPPPPDDPLTIINDTVPKLVAKGIGATFQFVVDDDTMFATVNRDGSVIADTGLHIDRFTGRRPKKHVK